jgi:DNA-binding NarL/FixJ family response regulator
LGRRYTHEEVQQIQALIDEGLTNRQIATRLGRSEAGIRNIRHRASMLTCGEFKLFIKKG